MTNIKLLKKSLERFYPFDFATAVIIIITTIETAISAIINIFIETSSHSYKRQAFHVFLN